MEIAIVMIVSSLVVETAVVTIATAVQAGVQVYSAVKQKEMAEKKAALERLSAQESAATERQKAVLIVAYNEASASASGIYEAGSPLLVNAQNRKDSMEQQRRIIFGGNERASILKKRGDVLLEAGMFQAGTSAFQSFYYGISVLS